jgi:hypothetical protein
MKKRLLAMIMTLAMCLSLLPTAAFAAVEPNDQIVEAGGSVLYNTTGRPVENGTLGEGDVTSQVVQLRVRHLLG